MIYTIFGIVLLLLAIWQFIWGVRAFRAYRAADHKGDNPMRILGYFYGFFFGVILLVIGISLLSGAFAP
ncbi:MAG: hypothetical protein LBI43_02605 [Streptococcaceae bacterium]|jgi:hypothetical protein|nr:hypothetical protein [Streptococcaceae bacterium]